MDNVRFEELANELLSIAEKIRTIKVKEYKGTEDRLIAFRRAGALIGEDAITALTGIMSKHTISIYDMISDDPCSHSLNQWEEKLCDQINYLLLLYAAIREEFEEISEKELAADAKLFNSNPSLES